jgi:hypothetical protein
MVGGQIRLGEETDLFLRLHTVEPMFWYDPGAIVSHYVSEMNMQLLFRLRRRFRSGKTRAALEGRPICSKEYVQELLALLSLLVQLVRISGLARSNRRVFLVEGLQKISYQLGYLLW